MNLNFQLKIQTKDLSSKVGNRVSKFSIFQCSIFIFLKIKCDVGKPLHFDFCKTDLFWIEIIPGVKHLNVKTIQSEYTKIFSFMVIELFTFLFLIYCRDVVCFFDNVQVSRVSFDSPWIEPALLPSFAESSRLPCKMVL